MSVSDNNFERLRGLPFADGSFAGTAKITTPISFSLAKDPSRTVTLLPVHNPDQVPVNLIKVLHAEFNLVIEEGQTYPLHNPLSYDEFVNYWFCAFVAILVEGHHSSLADATLHRESVDFFQSVFLGTFYVKPNYVGRSSHVCNAGFVVNYQKRGLGLGKELGAKYLQWAPQLGYVYSVFNLVYDTNVASIRIWDALDFERIGYVKNVAVLKGLDNFVGAIMYGKDLV